MRMIMRTVGGLLLLGLLVILAGCPRPQEKSQQASAVEKTPQPMSDGYYTYNRVIDKDGRIWERVHESKTTVGGERTSGYVFGFDGSDALAKPCPCCPVGVAVCCKP